jgi:hypothetical protein
MIWLSENFDVFMQNLLFEKILLLTTSILRGDYPSSRPARADFLSPCLRR